MFRAATTVRAFGLAFAMGAVLVSPAAGATVYGLIGNDRIVTFAAANPGTIKSDFAISGLDPGEVLTGIDIRPLDGKIYSVTTGGRVYRLDRGGGRYIATFTGVVTTFPFPGTLVPITGSNFGIDFAPFDRIRLVSDFDQNLRINPLNGGAAIDAPINDGAGESPYDLVGVAFADGSAVGAPFYGIDGLSSSLLLGAPGGVYRNTNLAGAVFDALGISLASQSEVGFDILFAGGINRAFLSAFDSLYRVDLATGRATLIGDIGISDIRGITTAAYVPEPPTWTLMLVGFGMIASAAWRRRRGTPMNAKRGFEFGGGAASASGRLCSGYRTLPMLFAAVAISMAGCSDGSGGGPITKPDGRGTVVVTVTDALGAPLAGASVYIHTSWSNEYKQAFADANGQAEVKDVLAGAFSVEVSGSDSYGVSHSRNLAPGATSAVDITAMPAAETTGGIARPSVPVGGVSEDGRTLEFSLEIVQVPRTYGEHWAYDTYTVQIAACTPDPDNDLPRFRPDCVSGADGFDAAYEGLAVSTRNVDAAGPYTDGTPNAAALLVDQSTHVIVNDSGDARLFAAKYFLSLSGENARTVLAAFSSDDPASGQFSLLPQKPVTVFPLENPQFTADGRSYFATVDQFAALEGGASPLFAAIDRTLDLAAADPLRGAKAVVVVTNGRDDTCGTRSECRSIVDALVQKSKATGVAIVAVGLEDAAGTADHEALGLLSQGTEHGAAFWAHNPDQLAPILGTVHSFLGKSEDTVEVTFRIQSPVVGAFASGRTVIGQVSLEMCPWECSYAVVPFVVQVP